MIPELFYEILDEALLEVFGRSLGLAPPDLPGAPTYANSTRQVMRRHSALVLQQLEALQLREAEQLLQLASRLARRLQLLIENVSVTLLLNFYIAQLEHNGGMSCFHGHVGLAGRTVGRDLVREMYGDASSLRVASCRLRSL